MFRINKRMHTTPPLQQTENEPHSEAPEQPNDLVEPDSNAPPEEQK